MTDTQVRYHIHTTITDVFSRDNLWFVHFAGSWEALSVGPDKPDFVVGDKVHITFMKEP